MEDIFTFTHRKQVSREGPLAQRMRPRNLAEFIGQEKILGEGQPLRQAITGDRLGSFIFYGPPGTGKTTLARIIATTTKACFIQLNALSSGVSEVRRVIKEAAGRWGLEKRRTILFIDEIHRFHKGQQDALLAAVEEGTVIFIGATTQNPYFSINAPLLSRTRLFSFEPLSPRDLEKVLQQALLDQERGLGALAPVVAPAALAHIINFANGDARVALNILEFSVETTPLVDGQRQVTLEIAEAALQKRAIIYDHDGDHHYDIISALIKSIRGSDPDAGLYWLARMIQGGEDPLFIARRLVIIAAEDIGNADPRALQVAVAAAQAVQFIGLPEGRIPLAQAVTYLACAPKSNAAYLGIEAALADAEKQRSEPVPAHLRDAHYRGARNLGHGIGYKYPHDFPAHFVPQQYLPSGLQDRRYYCPSEQGFEQVIKKRLSFWHKQKYREKQERKNGC